MGFRRYVRDFFVFLGFQTKASFSMGFRSYVREFFGVGLELARPSEAWCFAPGR